MKVMRPGFGGISPKVLAGCESESKNLKFMYYNTLSPTDSSSSSEISDSG